MFLFLVGATDEEASKHVWNRDGRRQGTFGEIKSVVCSELKVQAGKWQEMNWIKDGPKERVNEVYRVE